MALSTTSVTTEFLCFAKLYGIPASPEWRSNRDIPLCSTPDAAPAIFLSMGGAEQSVQLNQGSPVQMAQRKTNPRKATRPLAAAPTYRSRSAAGPAACSHRSVVAAAHPLWTWPRSAGPHRCGTASRRWPAHTRQSPRQTQLCPKSTVLPGGAQLLHHPGTSLPCSAHPVCAQGGVRSLPELLCLC